MIRGGNYSQSHLPEMLQPQVVGVRAQVGSAPGSQPGGWGRQAGFSVSQLNRPEQVSWKAFSCAAAFAIASRAADSGLNPLPST